MWRVLMSIEEFLSSHAFIPYLWDNLRCGYVDGDDMMCGYEENEHENKTILFTREDLAGHIDDPICSCRQCLPEKHGPGIMCSCGCN
jgi:hypothetical protein